MKLAFSIAEICAQTSIGRTTVYAAIKRGELSTRKIGRRTVVSNHELNRWIANLPDATPSKRVFGTKATRDQSGV